MDETLSNLRKLLKNAKRRLRYWSGIPSFTGFGFSTSGKTGSMESDMQYELAYCDCVGLADQIEGLTGHRPKVSDVREDFQKAFAAAMRSNQIGSGQ